MATRFIREATSQLSPAYAQQISAVQSQIPAIQQMFQLLVQGLQGQQQVENLNALEDASARGVLKSTIPVDKQAGIAQNILQQQGLFAAQQARDVGDIYSQVGALNVNQANDISQLANSLQQSYTSEQALAFQKKNADRQYKLQQKLGNQQYNLGLQAAQSGF